MRTGDIGKMDEEGYFYVVDRSKDMIMASGFNIYPREVEEVLLPPSCRAGSRGAGRARRVSRRNRRGLDRPQNGLRAKRGDAPDIIAYCKKELTPYKVPKIVEFRESLPKTLIGKVLKRELRATNQRHRNGIVRHTYP